MILPRPTSSTKSHHLIVVHFQCQTANLWSFGQRPQWIDSVDKCEFQPEQKVLTQSVTILTFQKASKRGFMFTSPSIRCDMDFAFKILSNCGSAASSSEIRGPKRRICGQFFNTKSFRLQSYDRQTHGKAINSFRKKFFMLFSSYQQKGAFYLRKKQSS